MKSILGLLVLASMSSSFACELLVKDVKLSAEEKQDFASRGFQLKEVKDFSGDDEGKLALLSRHQSDGIDVWDTSILKKHIFEIAKFWDYTEAQFDGRPTLKALDYVSKSKSLKAIKSCESLEAALDRKVDRILRTQKYPEHDRGHGTIFLK